MGWTTMAMPSGGARAYLDGLHSWSDSQRAYKVLDSSLLGGREYYAAVERIDLATGRREVFAGIALVRISRRSGEEFGCKEMSEDMGPYYYDCPVRILDKLTETENQISLDWRAKCREQAARRSAANKGPKLQAGQRVQFAEPIRFTSGAELSLFDIEAFGKKLVFVDPRTRSRYRITNARSRARTIVTSTEEGL